MDTDKHRFFGPDCGTASVQIARIKLDLHQRARVGRISLTQSKPRKSKRANPPANNQLADAGGAPAESAFGAAACSLSKRALSPTRRSTV